MLAAVLGLGFQLNFPSKDNGDIEDRCPGILRSSNQSSSEGAIQRVFYWVGEIEATTRHKIRWYKAVYGVDMEILNPIKNSKLACYVIGSQ